MRRKAEKIADDLAEVMDAFPGAFDGPDRDAIGQLRDTLDGIGEGDFYPVGIIPPGTAGAPVR